MQLMMHTENTAERKCQKEKLIELHQSACASFAQRAFLSIQVLSKPLHRARGSHLAWLQSPEIPRRGAPARSHCPLHLYLASGRSWMSIFLLSAFSAELPSLNQNTAWVHRLKGKKAARSWQVFAGEAWVGSSREIKHINNEAVQLVHCSDAWRKVCHSWWLFIPPFSNHSMALRNFWGILWLYKWLIMCHSTSPRSKSGMGLVRLVLADKNQCIEEKNKQKKLQEAWKKICSHSQRSNEQIRWCSAVVWRGSVKSQVTMKKAERDQLFPLLPREIQGIKWCLWNKVRCWKFECSRGGWKLWTNNWKNKPAKYFLFDRSV